MAYGRFEDTPWLSRKAGLVTSIIRLVKQLLTCPALEGGGEAIAAIGLRRGSSELARLSPIMFIFQAKARHRPSRPPGPPCRVGPCWCSHKVIGFYTMNELKYGGATYARVSECPVSCTRPERFMLHVGLRQA